MSNDTDAGGHQLSREFTVSELDEQRIIIWLETVVFPPIIEKQLANPDIAGLCKKFGVYRDGKLVGPYLGAVSVGPTYCFTPNSIGQVLIVRWDDHTLDLTDVGLW